MELPATAKEAGAHDEIEISQEESPKRILRFRTSPEVLWDIVRAGRLFASNLLVRLPDGVSGECRRGATIL